MRLFISSLLLTFLVMASSASAAGPCNDVYDNWFNISQDDNLVNPFLVNDSACMTIGGDTVCAWCNATANHFCYNDSATYACYLDDTRLPTNGEVDTGSNWGEWEDTLLLWLHLGDCSGTTCPDQSKYANDGTKTNSGNPANTSSNCLVGGCQDFTGVRNEGITMANDPIYNFKDNDGMTFVTHMRPGESVEAYEAFFQRGGASLELIIGSSQQLSIVYFNHSNTRLLSVSANSVFSYGTEYIVVGSYQSSTGAMTAFLDGGANIITGTTPSASARNPTGDLHLGVYIVGTTAFKDELDEARLYNRSWSQAESNAYYDNVKGTDVYSNVTGGPFSPPVVYNITTTMDVSPDPLYNLTAANFSIYYNESSGLAANITVNVTVNGVNISDAGLAEYTDVAADTTFYYYVEAENYTKHDNITMAVNLTTYSNLETDSDNITREIQNSPGSDPAVTWGPASVIIGDSLNMTGNSTDDDGDTVSYWYMLGWSNNTNITGWNTTIDFTVLAAHENETFRIWVMADDGEENSTAIYDDMEVTRLFILWPADGGVYYGKTFNYSFNFTTEATLPCYELIDNTSYSLGNISTGEHNNSRYVWYGSHVYNVTCYSLEDPTRVYYKNVSYSNYYASWNVSIFTENEWDVPLNITEANLSIIISCTGGETYVYNFTGTIITDVNITCDVVTVSAKVDYSTDSYLRERTPPCEGVCEVRMYMVDAMIYTVLQIPIYMSDYQYYDSKIELYKTSGGEHYTIAEGYFDVEHKYVTYLTKDNTYLIRLTLYGNVRDIGFLYAATATAQFLSLSEINLEPDITLISDNLLMAAEFDDPSLNQSTLRIQYQDLINMTTSVRVRIFSMSNNTAWYDSTFYGSSNFTISINNVNTTRHSVHFTVEHAVLGNSPIDYTVGVGSFAGWDLGLPAEMFWLYNAFAFFVILVTTWIITPENRLPGYILLLSELGIFSVGAWLAFEDASMALFIAFVVAGIIYEIRHKGVS